MAVFAKPSGGSFEPVSIGLCNAVLVDIVELGLKPDMNGNMKEKIRLVFQTDKKLSSGKLGIVGKQFTLSAHEKSALRQFCESWRGKKYQGKEFEALDLEKLIGKCAALNITHTDKNGEIYANIAAVMAPQKQIVPDGSYVRKKDRPVDGAYGGPAPRPTRTASPAAAREEDPLTPPVEDDDVPF